MVNAIMAGAGYDDDSAPVPASAVMSGAGRDDPAVAITRPTDAAANALRMQQPASDEFKADTSDPTLGAPSADEVPKQVRSRLAPQNFAEGAVRGVTQGAQNVGKAATEAGQGAGDWFGQNRSWVIPLLKGVGAMASSNSRYLGSAILQGMGAGAEAYSNEQQAESNLATSQATQGQIRATTQETEAEAQARWINNAGGMASVVHTPNGQTVTLIPVIDNKTGQLIRIPWVEYQKRVGNGESLRFASAQEVAGTSKAGTAPSPAAPVVGPATYNAGKVASPAVAAPGAVSPAFQPVGAPGGAPTMAPPIGSGALTSGAGQKTPASTDPYLNFSDGSQQAAKNESRMSGDPVAVKNGDSYYATTTANGISANNMAPTLRSLAGTVAGVAQRSGPGVEGTMGEGRANFLKGLQTIGHGFGVKDVDMPNWLKVGDDNDIMNKFRTVIGTMRAHGADQNSYAGMQQLAAALPGMNLTPAANAEIMSQLLLANQQDRDRYSHLQQYGNAQGGAGYDKAYAGAANNYINDYKTENYGRMADEVKDIIQNKAPLVHDIMSGVIKPEKAQAIFKKLGYSPSTARAFY